jgi:DNA-binding CsgD family transcriptional regulator
MGNELDEALDLATKIDEMQYLALVRSARAEAAWLAGNLELVAEEASAAFDDNLRNRNPWIAGEVALWLHRSGLAEVDRAGIADQYALEIAGNWQAAAAGWEARGLPLEAARARTIATNESDLRLALSTFDTLGARPDALRTARRLRVLGFRGIPRGPHLATRSRFGDLTTRELEVLALLATGSSNSDIARQLFLSPRTVDHHVSAILAKLNVSSRLGAVDRARQAGLLDN